MKIDAHLHSFLDTSSLFANYPKRDASDIIAFLEKKYYHDRPERQQAIEYAIETLAPYYKLIYGSDYPYGVLRPSKPFTKRSLRGFSSQKNNKKRSGRAQS